MYLSEEVIYFIKRINKLNDEQEFSVDYDDKYDIKYLFYWGHKNRGGIISPLTLFEYGRRVVTFTPKSLEFIKNAEIKDNNVQV